MQMPSAEFVLPHSPVAPGLARDAVVTAIERWGHDRVLEAATIVVSELVTNAIRHGEPPVVLTITADTSGLRVEVSDGSPVSPSPMEVPPDAVRGRGVALVDTLSRRWGCATWPDDGKTVWAEIGA